MGLMYTAELDTAGTTGAIDIFELLAPSDAAVVIHEIRLTQSTEEGNAQAEQLELVGKRVTGSPTTGSGGATPTPRPLTGGAPAAGSTVGAGNTTKLSGGTSVNLFREGWNIQAGFYYLPPPEMRIEIAPSTRFVLEQVGAPDDAVDFHGTITFEEIGG